MAVRGAMCGFGLLVSLLLGGCAAHVYQYPTQGNQLCQADSQPHAGSPVAPSERWQTGVKLYAASPATEEIVARHTPLATPAPSLATPATPATPLAPPPALSFPQRRQLPAQTAATPSSRVSRISSRPLKRWLHVAALPTQTAPADVTSTPTPLVVTPATPATPVTGRGLPNRASRRLPLSVEFKHLAICPAGTPPPCSGNLMKPMPRLVASSQTR